MSAQYNTNRKRYTAPVRRGFAFVLSGMAPSTATERRDAERAREWLEREFNFQADRDDAKKRPLLNGVTGNDDGLPKGAM